MNFRKVIASALTALGLLIWSSPAGCQEIGTIQVADLRLRSGPGKAYRIISRLEKGTTVSIIGHEKGWLKIEHGQQTGFIFNSPEFISLVKLPNGPPAQASDALKPAPVRADNVERRLDEAKSDLADIARKEREVLDAFNDAEEALNRVREQVRETTSELDGLNAEIAEIEHRSAELAKEIRIGEVYAAKRLVALYKLNWLGRVQLLATADSFFDFINRKVSLERILGQDESVLEALNNNKRALETLLTRLNANKAEKRSLEIALKERAGQLGVRQGRRKTLLDAIRSEKALGLAALKSLQEAARSLDDTLRQIEPSAVPDGAQPGTRTSAKSFIQTKGLLSWPVKGKIISFFGPYRDKKYAVTNFQSGINIQAERGEPIRAVSQGHTIFAGWFKGFGNMMILDHGNHYYTVYAHLEEVFKVKGDRVEKGEVIATVGDSGSLMGPALHFEVRHHGKPVDPLAWIQKG